MDATDTIELPSGFTENQLFEYDVAPSAYDLIGFASQQDVPYGKIAQDPLYDDLDILSAFKDGVFTDIDARFKKFVTRRQQQNKDIADLINAKDDKLPLPIVIQRPNEDEFQAISDKCDDREITIASYDNSFNPASCMPWIITKNEHIPPHRLFTRERIAAVKKIENWILSLGGTESIHHRIWSPHGYMFKKNFQKMYPTKDYNKFMSENT